MKTLEGMKMMGLHGFIYWLSWITFYTIAILFQAIAFAVILPLASVYSNANNVLPFLLFFLFGISAMCLALLLSTFFDNHKVIIVAPSS